MENKTDKTEQLVTEEEMGEVSGGSSIIDRLSKVCDVCGIKSAGIQELNGMNICAVCQAKHTCMHCKAIDVTKDFTFNRNSYCKSCG